MEEIKLVAETRSQGEKLSSDYIPAVAYGKGLETRSLKVKRSEFEKIFRKHGESTLISLEHAGQRAQVLVKDLQKDVLKNFVTHIDFYQVNMKEEVKAEVALRFVGESKAIKELGGTLLKDIDTIEVECLPGDLVEHIDVDISVLNTFDDGIRLHDIRLPKNMKLVSQTNEMVATVRPPKVSAEATTPAAEPTKEAAKEAEKK